MSKKNFISSFCLLFTICAVSSMVFGGSNHRQDDRDHHEDLSAYWRLSSKDNLNDWEKLWILKSVGKAPSNADGEVDLYVWLKDADPSSDTERRGYLGGESAAATVMLSKSIFNPFAPSAEDYWGEARITGKFLVGNPGDIRIHYEHGDHEASQPGY